MRGPDLSMVPPELVQRLSSIKPYCMVLLRKGPNHGSPDATRIIQSEHLPYLFRLRDQGLVALSAPVIADADVRALALYNTADTEAVRNCLDEDPAVQQGIFRYEMYPILGLPGDQLS